MPWRFKLLAIRSVPRLVREKIQAAAALLLNEIEQHFGLAVIGYFEGLESNVLRRLQRGTKRQPHGVSGIVLHQLGHRALHGGGEAQRLALLGQVADDAPDGRKESHVQHTIRLIQHEGFHASECY